MIIEKAKELINEKVAIAKASADNENYMIPMTIKEANEILAELEQPEPGEFTKGLRITASKMEYSIRVEIERACDRIDRLEAENKELVKEHKRMAYCLKKAGIEGTISDS